jgi:hypothetical protein
MITVYTYVENFIFGIHELQAINEPYMLTTDDIGTLRYR